VHFEKSFPCTIFLVSYFLLNFLATQKLQTSFFLAGQFEMNLMRHKISGGILNHLHHPTSLDISH